MERALLVIALVAFVVFVIYAWIRGAGMVGGGRARKARRGSDDVVVDLEYLARHLGSSAAAAVDRSAPSLGMHFDDRVVFVASAPSRQYQGVAARNGVEIHAAGARHADYAARLARRLGSVLVTDTPPARAGRPAEFVVREYAKSGVADARVAFPAAAPPPHSAYGRYDLG